jgi:hypothetical protein
LVSAAVRLALALLLLLLLALALLLLLLALPVGFAGGGASVVPRHSYHRFPGIYL